MTNKKLMELLAKLNACDEAVAWVGARSLKQVWAECERGDWMLWLCARMEGKRGWPSRQDIVQAACDCAELVMPIYEEKYPKDDRVRKCIKVTRQWAKGKAYMQDVHNAANAAANAANATYATYGAYAGSYAAANAAAYAAAAADDAYASSYSAYSAAFYSAKTKKECANICRKRLKVPA